MLFTVLLSTLVACGGESHSDAEPAAAHTPAEAPKPATPPPAPPAAPPAPPASGPYTPDDLSKAAYDKAAAAGADATKANPKAGNAEAIAKGKAHYSAKCVACHGAEGRGDGVAGAALPQKPSNFHWKERWEATSVGVKHWVLKNGIQGSAMAPLGLSDDEAWELLAFIEAEFVGK